MKTNALPPPTVTSPATGVHLPVSGGAKTEQYFAGLTGAMSRAGLLEPMPGKRGQLTLDASTTRKLLQLPEVAADPGRFVKEAFLGSSGIVFNFGADADALAPFARALGEKGQGETFLLLRNEMFKYFSNAGPKQLVLDDALAEAFERGKSGTAAMSGVSSFKAPAAPSAAPWAPPTASKVAPAAVPTSPLGRLLEGAAFTAYASPSDDKGTLTLSGKNGQSTTVSLTADVFGDGAVAATFSEPGPFPTTAQATRKDLEALLRWFDGANPGNRSLTMMMSALREQLSAG